MEIDDFFRGEHELLEVLLAIDAWYTEEAQNLEALLKKGRALAKAHVPELEAA